MDQVATKVEYVSDLGYNNKDKFVFVLSDHKHFFSYTDT